MFEFTENERTHGCVDVRLQPDGPGLRYGVRGEVTAVANLTPEGGKLIRERIGQFQAESRYWEGRVASVHELRVILINNDTQALVTVTYDGDFAPYLADIFREAGPWFDELMKGAWEGYESIDSDETKEMIFGSLVTAQMFYVNHHDLTVKDTDRLKRLGAAVTELLDSAS